MVQKDPGPQVWSRSIYVRVNTAARAWVWVEGLGWDWEEVQGLDGVQECRKARTGEASLGKSKHQRLAHLQLRVLTLRISHPLLQRKKSGVSCISQIST